MVEQARRILPEVPIFFGLEEWDEPMGGHWQSNVVSAVPECLESRPAGHCEWNYSR